MADETTEGAAEAVPTDHEASWTGQVEARLAALEDKTGLSKAKEKADNAKEDK